MDGKIELTTVSLIHILEDVFRNYELNEVTAFALKFLLSNPYERALIVDRQGKVQFLDMYSEQALGLSPGAAKNMRVHDLLPESSIPTVLKTGRPVTAWLFKVNGKKMISAAYPLVTRGQLIGAIARILFHSIEELERIYLESQRAPAHSCAPRPKHLEGHEATYTFKDIIFVSPKMKEAVEMAKRVSILDIDVLIVGETGTGKELFAHGIHNHASSHKPFVKVNCPALPTELAESELFGYEKGAFTGASAWGKIGSFEAANGGTLFLDEISSLSLTIQAKLLRTLQEREITRIGSTRTKKVSFRLIAATNSDLLKLVEEGKFRLDLYHRIAKFIIHIPPLRERKEDIPVYVNHFLKIAADSFKFPQKALSEKALQILLEHKWPGNVRELINVLQHAVIKAWEKTEIGEKELPPYLLEKVSKDSPKCLWDIGEVSPDAVFRVRDRVREIEKQLIVRALEKFNGSRKKAFEFLGMPRSTFYEKIKAYKIKYPRGDFRRST